MIIQRARLQSSNRLTLVASRPEDRAPHVLPDAARGMGICVVSTRGTGKSTVLGRVIAFSDFYRPTFDESFPVVIIDPVGGTIDNFLDKIGQQDLGTRTKLWERVRYHRIDGLDGRVVPWPIFAEAFAGERYSSRAQRLIEVIARTDPELRTRPMLGLNALSPIAKAAGIVLCALGLGVTEMQSLVSDPNVWEDRLRLIEPDYPEAVARLRALGQLTARDRDMQTSSLQAKLSHFELDGNYRAMFGATTGGINWAEVFEKKLAVLLDFRDIPNKELKRFCLLWVYHSFMTYLKHRGQGYGDKPVSFIVDELSHMVGSKDDELLTQDINELVNEISRSHGIWFTLATQELFQLPEQIADTVLSAGTVILGQTADPKAAEKIARRFFPYEPYKIKKKVPKYGTASRGAGLSKQTFPVETGVQTTEYTMAEQINQNAQVLLELKQGHFLIGQSRREGELPTRLQPFTTSYLDTAKPQQELLASLRRELMQRDGISEQKLLKEIRSRTVPTISPRQSQRTSATGNAPPRSPLPRKPGKRAS
jgi:hypothetical protein